MDYCRPVFGYLLIIGEFIWAVRQPYNNLIKSAGHFKETRIGAWIEVGVNIIVSVALINRFELVGIAIGTMVAMIVRTVEFIYYANRFILKRNVWFSIKKIIIMLTELIIIVSSINFNVMEYNSYVSWGINACLIFVYDFILILICNLILYPKERKEIISKLKDRRK